MPIAAIITAHSAAAAAAAAGCMEPRRTAARDLPAANALPLKSMMLADRQ